MLVKLEHPSKTRDAIDVRSPGSSIEESEKQLMHMPHDNARSFGMSNDERFGQLEKRYDPADESEGNET